MNAIPDNLPEYDSIKCEIDAAIATGADSARIERKKAEILAAHEAYLQFVGELSGFDTDTVRATLLELGEADDFLRSVGENLDELTVQARHLQTGELRVHSATVYVITRLAQPRIFVETGIANGKSSAFILEALRRNGDGRLISVDIPHFEAKGESEFGAVIPRGREVGWLVPDSLRASWQIELGDAKAILPRLVSEIPQIDIFMHDSLKTYEHVTFELETARNWVRPYGLILCDDVLTTNAFLDQSTGLKRGIFGTLGLCINE